MKHRFVIVLTALAFGACSTSSAYDGWISYFEQTVTGEPIPFTTGDTVCGPVWSNDCIHIVGHPVFYYAVITGASQVECPMDSAVFLGPDPIFGYGMPAWPQPAFATRVREGAAQQGNFYDFPGQTLRAVFQGASVIFYHWQTGTPFDSTHAWPLPISQDAGTCIFINGPLELYGVVTGKVTIGSAGTLRILDNIRYSDSEPLTGRIPDSQLDTAPNVLGLVSESGVTIANTPQNGRENSGMPNGTWGREQGNPNLTDIVITAAIESPNGGLTFEDQNDSATGYVCDCQPDDRGTVYIFGSVRQYRRGYLNRMNNVFTGYQLNLWYDRRLMRMRPPCFWPAGPEGETTDTLDFGEVTVDSLVWDTAHVYTSFWGTLGSVYASYPFWATRTPPFDGTHFVIPVRFTPPRAEQYHGFLSVVTVEHYFQIPLFGRGVPPSASDSPFIPHPSSLSLSCSPNPFNARTEIRFNLPQAEEVSLDLFDITGRKVMTVLNGNLTAGEHAVPLAGSDLPSGVYFARLLTAHGQTTLKLALIR